MDKKKIELDFQSVIPEKPTEINIREGATNNQLFIVKTVNNTYIYKSTKKASKELFSHHYLESNNFLPVFENTVGGNDFIVQKYQPNVVFMSPELRLDDILKRQHVMLTSSSNDFDVLIDNLEFRNLTPDRMFARLEKHDLSFGDTKKIKSCLEYNFGYRDYFPKIFVHGDLIEGNVLLTPAGIKYIDFERSVYDSPTWDLPPLLFRSEVNEVSDLIDLYVKRSDMLSKNLKNAIMYDYVSFLTTFGISVEQSISDVARKNKYLLRIKNHLNGVGL